jgi:hypothetical protein
MPNVGALRLGEGYCSERRLEIPSGDAALAPLQLDLLEVVELNRPLFASMAEDRRGEYGGLTAAEVVDRMAGFAALKLCEGREEPKDRDLLACMCLRLGLCYSDPLLGDELVQKHMAVCFSVSAERTRIVAKYVSEPLLAEAACRLLQGRFSRALESLVPSLQHTDLASPHGGTLGELVAAIVLTVAFDTAKAQRVGFLQRAGSPDALHTTPIALRRFLDVFLGAEEQRQLVEACRPAKRSAAAGQQRGRGRGREQEQQQEQEQEQEQEQQQEQEHEQQQEQRQPTCWERLQASWVRFLAFYQTAGEVSRARLVTAFRHGSALIARPGQEGFDLALPLVLPARRHGTAQHTRPSQHSISGVFVQVKNRTREISPGECEDILARLCQSAQQVCGRTRPCIAVLMQVGRGGISQGRDGATTAQARVHMRENVLCIVKPQLDAAVYPFLAGRDLASLRSIGWAQSAVDTIIDPFLQLGIDRPAAQEPVDFFGPEVFARFSPLE